MDKDLHISTLENMPNKHSLKFFKIHFLEEFSKIQKYKFKSFNRRKIFEQGGNTQS